MLEDLVGLLSNTFISMAPILLASTGEIITERSGVVNIGLEGVFMVSSFVATVTAFYTGNPYLGLLAGVLVGSLSGALHGFISVYLRGDQVIAGVGFNTFAYGVSVLLMISLWGSYSNSPPVVKTQNIVITLAPRADLIIPPVTLLAVSLAVVSWWLLEKTRWGLKLRACGEDPRAAEAAGINVARTRFLATVIGGAMAGLGGAYLVVGWLGPFVKVISAGRGFIALANVAFSNWNPLLALLGALVFGFSDALKTFIPIKLQLITGQQYTAESYIFFTLPYVVTLLVVSVAIKRVKAPRALGKPYIKE